MRLRDEFTLAGSRTILSGAIQEPSGAAGLAEELPENLRKWFCDITLVTWIDEEIKRFAWIHPQVALYSHEEHQEDDPALMASVLVFAFASEMFASEDIAWACRFDPVFHRLCNGRPPFPQQLCAFRRKNRPMLVQVLTGVFKSALNQKLGRSAAPLSHDISRNLHDQAVERLDVARHMDTVDTAQNL